MTTQEGKKVAKRMRRTYRTRNGVVEVTDFWARDSAQPRRGKAKASNFRKQEANRNQAVHILARKLNNNFQQGDLFFTLTYSERAFRDIRSRAYASLPKGSREKKAVKRDAILFEAEKDGKLLVRRIRENGARDCKYVLVGSDMDGRSGDETRVHLHLILSGEAFEFRDRELTMRAVTGGRTMEELWGRGAVDYEFLRGGSYASMAAYLIRQTRDIKNHKRYVCSRNLEAVEFEETELDRDAEPMKAPAGAKVEEYQHDPTNPYGMVYLRYIEPSEPEKKSRSKRKGGGT